MIKKIASLSFAGLFAIATAAHADTITFPASTHGTCCFSVTATDTTTNVVKVEVDLTSGAQSFVNSGNGNNHPGFAFNLAVGSPSIALSFPPSGAGSLWAGEALLTGADTSPSFGTFEYYFDNYGNGSGDLGPLVFFLTGTGLNASDFTTNAAGYYFAADIQAAGSPGATGEAGLNGAPTITTTTPEPSSLLLFGTGLIGAAGLFRRRIASAMHSR